MNWFKLSFVMATAAIVCPGRGAETLAAPSWKERHDQLVVRLRNLSAKEGAFGAAFRPLFHAALPWYELWGGRNADVVDADMVSPEDYATALAQSLEQGRNYFAENPASLFPLVFSKAFADGRTCSANYWLTLPAGFPGSKAAFPLVIGLHGSGWIGHKISFKHVMGAAGRSFSVTPIDMDGPWKIDFLNAYLDELMALLPIDADRVYVQGHSLGGMATWEWAMDNPERFAAIAPCSGIGEPYRAIRLKYVPSWAIHGEKDDVVPSGFADQMVTALESCGAPVRYFLIKDGAHNMPPDLDYRQIEDWFLHQTRSTIAAPADPRDGLALSGAGWSPWTIIVSQETPAWKSEPVNLEDRGDVTRAVALLFKSAHQRGERVDAPYRAQLDPKTQKATLWLPVPKTLHVSGVVDPSVILLPQTQFVRFYFRGERKQALEHVRSLREELIGAGHVPTGTIWITNLSIWQNTPGAIAEYWLETK